MTEKPTEEKRRTKLLIKMRRMILDPDVPKRDLLPVLDAMKEAEK